MTFVIPPCPVKLGQLVSGPASHGNMIKKKWLGGAPFGQLIRLLGLVLTLLGPVLESDSLTEGLYVNITTAMNSTSAGNGVPAAVVLHKLP